MESKPKQEAASGTNRPASHNRGSSIKPIDRNTTDRDENEVGGDMGSSENMSESKKSSEGGKVKRVSDLQSMGSALGQK